jgi:exopolysaccharide biosynthesis predicted pyruvyltransferase EpsI
MTMAMENTVQHARTPASAGLPAPEKRTKVRDYLAQWRGSRIYRVPLLDAKGVPVGNNGDRLMVLGTDVVFRDLGLTACERPEDADLIAVSASGGMLEKMQRIPHLFRTLCAKFPDTPLCVLPSSYYWPTRPFAAELGERKAPTTLFCREPISFKHLTEEHTLGPGVEVILDHDMAFELEHEPIVTSRLAMPQRTVVMVERTDVEHVSVGMDSSKLGLRRHVSKHMPAWMKRSLYPLVNRARAARRTPFRERCEELLARHCPGAVSLPRDIADLSNVNTCSFDGFCDRIAAAQVVFTTRLHAGLYAAMLGRRTFIFDGAYHKIRGIYELTLKDREHVTFVEQ